MRLHLMRLLLASSLVLVSFALTSAFAQSVEVEDGATVVPEGQSGTGKGKAKEYFQTRKSVRRSEETTAPLTNPHFLSIHFGGFFTGQAYKWGQSDNPATAFLNNFGVTYRLGEWVNSMDFSLRIEYTSYHFLDGQSAKKISIGPVITFPDANSRFPLYFGGGLGAGLFIQQVTDKSPVALDWQIFGGVRFLDVIEHIGFMVEAGLKNHVLLGSEGQFNGVFINVGSVFAF